MKILLNLIAVILVLWLGTAVLSSCVHAEPHEGGEYGMVKLP